MHYINYPGAIATSIYEIINCNTGLFLIGWQFTAFLFSALIFLFAFYSLRENFANQSAAGKFFNSPFWFLLFSFLGIFLLWIPNLVLKELNPDESQWIANAATFLNGGVLWKNVSGYTGGPLLFVPLSLLYYTGIGINYASIRLFGLFICILPTFFFVFLLFKNSFSNRLAILLSVPLLLFFSFASSNDFIAYDSEMIPMLLTAVSIYLIVKLLSGKKIFLLFLIGLILGLFPFAKLQAMPIALSIFLCVTVDLTFYSGLSIGSKLKQFFILITGCAAPSLVVLIYLVMNNATADFVNEYIVKNIFYAQTGFGNHIAGIEKWFLFPYMAYDTIEMRWLLPVTVTLIFFSTTVIYKNRKIISSAAIRKISYLFFIVFLSYIAVCSPGNIYPHYLLLFVIPWIAFTGLLFGTALAFLLHKKSLPKITFAYLALSIALPLFIQLYIGNSGIKFVDEQNNYKLSPVSTEILKYTLPNEKLAVWGWANKFYVETGLTQGTRGVNSYYEVAFAKLNNTEPLEKYIADLELNQPIIFLDATAPYFPGFEKQEALGFENFPALNNYISSRYKLVAEINLKKIFVRNDRLQKIN